VARNPSLAKQSFGYAILGFALTEAIASFAPMMAFLISSVFRSKKEGFSLLKQEKPPSHKKVVGGATRRRKVVFSTGETSWKPREKKHRLR